MLIGIVVIKDSFNNKNAFTIEEIIASGIIIAIAFSAFRNITVLNYSISNVFVIILILIIGFKNGIFIGGLAGVTIGVCLGLISNIDFFQISVMSICGIISGIFGHILMPEKFNYVKQLDSEKLLTNVGEHRLSYYEEIKEKINAVAQTISDMNNSFFIKNSENSESLNKEIYIDNFLNLVEDYSENIFYEDLINNEVLIADFFECLEKDDIITEKEMIDIFKKYNNYILLRDEKIKNDLQEIIKIANRTYRELQINSIKVKVKKEEAEKLESELKNVSNIISSITKNEKDKNIFENKEKEIEVLLKGKMYPIKKVYVNKCQNGKYIIELNLEYKENFARERSKISNIESIISKCLNTKISFQKDKKNSSTGDYRQIYSSEDKFVLQVGSGKISKDGAGKTSGDTNLQIRLNDGKYLLAISDGMGSGEKAKTASKFVINSLNTLLSNGFEQEETLRLINSELNFNKDDEMYATVDMSILDLYSGKIIISKNGACNTYIKNKKNVKVFSGNNLPVGIVPDAGLDSVEIDLNENDIILMCSDGLLDSKLESKNDWVKEFLENVNTNNVQKITDLVINEAIDNSFGKPKDDITVIVAKIIKKK